jgi:hypothetical protein
MSSLSVWVLALVVAVSVTCGFVESSHVFKAKAHLGGRSIHAGTRADKDTPHSVIFVIKQRNLDKLDDLLLSVSDPESTDYGKHWSREQMGEFTQNQEASAAVLEYLQTHHDNSFHIERRSRYDEYIVVKANVNVWESMFNTQFFQFKHADWEGQSIHRAVEYSLPAELDKHLLAVGNVAEFPSRKHGSPVVTLTNDPVAQEDIHKVGVALQSTVAVTPQFVSQFYNIVNNTGSRLTSQMIYSDIGQTLSTDDLSSFQSTFGLPQETIAGSYNGYVNTTCNVINDCSEANLDFQYIMSTAQNVPTYSYYNVQYTWYDWLVEINSWSHTPKVISMSYGSLEVFVDSVEFAMFNSESAKLGVMGTTLIVASGDDGAPNYLATSGYGCGYWTDFPSASPYWTVVGGTMVGLPLVV